MTFFLTYFIRLIPPYGLTNIPSHVVIPSHIKIPSHPDPIPFKRDVIYPYPIAILSYGMEPMRLVHWMGYPIFP